MFFTIRRAVVAATLMLAAAVLPAKAQQPLRLEIRAGRVNLHAQNVPLRQILTEWARIGGTKFVNVERVTGNPVTLDLNGVSERQALDTLLRSVAGYVLASRQASAAGASAFDRVVILASSTAPRVTQQPINNGPATRVPQPVFQPEPNDPEDNPPGDVAPGNRVPRPVFPPGIPRPTGQPQPDPPDPPDDNSPGGVTVSPSNPFGVPAGSSSLPGVVTPVPEPQQPNRPPRIQDPD
jgi:hypothetical protein